MSELDLTAEDAEENETRLTSTIIGAAIEVKSVDALLPIHDAQLLGDLKPGGWQVGLIFNFNVTLLKRGIRRRVLNLKEQTLRPLR